MLPPTIYDNFDDGAEEAPELSEMTDEMVIFGASMGMPEMIREFLRRQYGKDTVMSEEEIAARADAVREELLRREDQLEGIDPENDVIENV